MKVKRGDKVKFLNDIGGGTVTETDGLKLAKVMTEDGFEVPVPLSELILVKEGSRKEQDDHSFMDEESLQDKGDDRTLQPEKIDDAQKTGKESYIFGPAGEETEKITAERNLLFALAETGVKDRVDAWLINDSNFNVLYTFLQKQDEFFVNLKTGMIEADTKILIKAFTRDDINNFVHLKVQAIFFRTGLFNPVPPSQKEFKLDPIELFGSGSFVVNDFFDEKASIVHLISDAYDREQRMISEQEISRIILEKKEKPGPDIKKEIKSDPFFEEVDLHIEELVDDHQGMSGREVLDIQLSRFTTALEGAIRGKTKRIVFIHGIGNGKLKFEIRKALDKKYPRLKYQDASFEEYGYGATMVILRR